MDDMLKVASCYHAVFTSDQGKVIMAQLADQCGKGHLDGNVFMDMSVNLNPEQYMFLREGQDSVFRHIIRMIKYFEENRNGIDG